MLLLWLVAGDASAAPVQQVASIAGANLQRPAWSPDGAKLSFEANFHEEKRVELYLGDPALRSFQKVVAQQRPRSGLTEGFRTTPAAGGLVVHELSFAPKGLDVFVYAASNDAFDYDLYVSGGSTLAPGPGADGGAQWSPDGGFIAFTSARTGEGDLYLVDTKAIEAPPRQLTKDAGSSELYVDWSSDGRSLVYVAHTDTGDNLWLLPAIGAQPARLTAWPGNQIRPRFAPSGQRVAFYANHEDPGRFDLYIVEIGSSPTLVARGVYPDAHGPSWSPDGQHLVYVADDDARFDPVAAVRVADPSRQIVFDLGTVGNEDLDVAVRNGSLVVAVVAQGLRTDTKRDYKRLYVGPLPPLP